MFRIAEKLAEQISHSLSLQKVSLPSSAKAAPTLAVSKSPTLTQAIPLEKEESHLAWICRNDSKLVK